MIETRTIHCPVDFSPISLRNVRIGAHAKGMLKRFLFGTTTMSVMYDAPCPVWDDPESA